MRNLLPGNEQSNEDEEFAKVVLGPPGLQAHVPFKRSSIAWIGRLFGRSEQSPIRVWKGDVTVWASEDDDGAINVFLDVVNLGSKPLFVHQFYAEQVLAGGYAVSTGSVMFTPPTDPVAVRDFQRICFRCTIGAPGIRRILQSTQAAQNAKSSPRLEFKIGGTIEATAGKRLIRERIAVQVDSPLLLFSCPSARVG